MNSRAQINGSLHDLLEMIRFIEKVSTRLHGVLDESAIYSAVNKEFAKESRYNATVLLLSNDGTTLRCVETAQPHGETKAGEAVGFPMESYSIELERSTICREVINEGKTLQSDPHRILGELLPSPSAHSVPKLMGREKGICVLTPLKRRGEIIGVLVVSSADLAEYFLPAVKDLAQHISAALDLADESAKHKKTEETLEQAQAELEQVFTAAVPLCVISREYSIVRASDAFCSLFAMERNDFVGKKCYEILQSPVCNSPGCPMEQVLDGMEQSEYEAEKEFEDGRSVWYVVKAVPHRGSDGELLGVIESYTDITERRHQEELTRSCDRLRETLEKTVRSLTSAVEMRDPCTIGHQRRVTKLACAIAEEMGLTEKEIEGVRVSGLIHDIGKVTVPVAILTKPGPLTDAEYSLVKAHSQSGYNILKMIDFPRPVAQIVLQHHERMDGSGYPQGLKGEQILFEARVLAVADVVEAMSSQRAYREALGPAKALEEIQRNKGLLYDAKVVDACLQLFYEKRFDFETSPA